MIFEKWISKAVEKRVQMTLKAMNFNLGMNVGIGATYADNQLKNLYDASYNSNVDFYSVIKRIATKFAQLPRYEYRKKEKKHLDEFITDSELSALLLNPNSVAGADLFFESICSHYLLSGEAFIWKNRGGTEQGKPVELYVIPSQNVEVVADKNDVFGVSGYIFDMDGQRIPIPKEDMIHWKTFNPNFNRYTGEHLRGFSPIQPQKKVLTQSNASTDAMVAMFQNGGAKGVLFNETFDNLDEVQRGQIKDVIDTKINSTRVKSSVATIQGKWSYLDIGKDSVDMQLVEANEMTVKRFCNANGLPYELFQSDTTFANKEQAWMFFITNTLMPLASSLDAEMNRSLIPDFKTNTSIATDFSDLPEMAELKKRGVEAANIAWWITPNEKRKMMMEEPIKDVNMDKIYIPSGFVELTQANMPIGENIDFVE
jgi:HK97 family phage portal protein